MEGPIAINIARRTFISALGGTAVVWPLAARAQQPTKPVVGFLSSGSQRAFTTQAAAFLQGLKETGFVEGQNVTVEYRWAEGQYDRLPTMADELVRRPVTVLAASGGTAVARAAKAATTGIPIVFATADDPVATGLVTTLSRPGGNLTGVSLISGVLSAKNLELLHQLVPTAKTIGVLVNPNSPSAEIQLKDAQEAANSIGVKALLLKASTERDIDSAFMTLLAEHAGALVVVADPFFFLRREQFVALAARHAVPAIHFFREFIAAGGLMSYGTSLSDGYHWVGIYVGRILKGEKPADLPVIQSTKYELVINLNAAKALGLTVPQTLLVAADEVIE
jgi:putative tryptophan/tyrosine transport system substrate-binding protein